MTNVFRPQSNYAHIRIYFSIGIIRDDSIPRILLGGNKMGISNESMCVTFRNVRSNLLSGKVYACILDVLEFNLDLLAYEVKYFVLFRK